MNHHNTMIQYMFLHVIVLLFVACPSFFAGEQGVQSVVEQELCSCPDKSEATLELGNIGQEKQQQTTLQLLKTNSHLIIAALCGITGLYIGSRCREGAFNVISTVCALMGLYMSYRNNYETLRLNRAAFIIDKGALAFENLFMIDEGQYAQFEAKGKQVQKALASIF